MRIPNERRTSNRGRSTIVAPRVDPVYASAHMATSRKPSAHGRIVGKYGDAIALGTNFTAGMLACVFIGYQLGTWFGHQDAWVLGGVFAGLTYGGFEVWKIVRRLEEQDRDREHDADGDS
jgi:F0F1-type ATP synthase assembly protein I